MQEGDVLELAGDQCELRKVTPAQGERVAALVDDDSLPPAVLAIVLGRDHQAADGDLGPEFVDEISKFGSGFADPADLLGRWYRLARLSRGARCPDLPCRRWGRRRPILVLPASVLAVPAAAAGVLFVSCDVETLCSPEELDVTCPGSGLPFSPFGWSAARSASKRSMTSRLTRSRSQLAICQKASPRQGQREGTNLFRKVLDQCEAKIRCLAPRSRGIDLCVPSGSECFSARSANTIKTGASFKAVMNVSHKNRKGPRAAGLRLQV